MQLTITYNGFHGRQDFTVRPLRVTTDENGRSEIHLTNGAANRISKAVCGISSCRCGEGIPEHCVVWANRDGEVRGHYPQQ